MVELNICIWKIGRTVDECFNIAEKYKEAQGDPEELKTKPPGNPSPCRVDSGRQQKTSWGGGQDAGGIAAGSCWAQPRPASLSGPLGPLPQPLAW